MTNIKKNIEDNFIWRNPLDSEEAKGNVVYTCSEHGKETYFRIKALEGQRNMKDLCVRLVQEAWSIGKDVGEDHQRI